MGNRKVERTVGDVIKIALKDGNFCFGRVLEEPLIAFYDLKTDGVPEIEEIVRLPILFKVWVMNHAITSGSWEVVGHQQTVESVFPLVLVLSVCYLYEGKERHLLERQAHSTWE